MGGVVLEAIGQFFLIITVSDKQKRGALTEEGQAPITTVQG